MGHSLTLFQTQNSIKTANSNFAEGRLGKMGQSMQPLVERTQPAIVDG